MPPKKPPVVAPSAAPTPAPEPAVKTRRGRGRRRTKPEITAARIFDSLGIEPNASDSSAGSSTGHEDPLRLGMIATERVVAAHAKLVAAFAAHATCTGGGRPSSSSRAGNAAVDHLAAREAEDACDAAARRGRWRAQAEAEVDVILAGAPVTPTLVAGT